MGKNNSKDALNNKNLSVCNMSDENEQQIPQITKYTTHLPKDIIKSLKRYAVDNDLKDYEVVRNALTEFLKNYISKYKLND